MPTTNQFIYLLIFSLLISCNTSIESDNNTKELPRYKNDKVIGDITQYDSMFVSEISSYNGLQAIIDSYIIVDNDTVRFPQDIPLQKQLIFKGGKGGYTSTLILNRINYTTISYSFSIMDAGKGTTIYKKGNAVLTPMFFLASEVDEDDITGDAYGSTEYADKKNETFIRIEILSDNSNPQRASVIFANASNDSIKLFAHSPTLRIQ